MTDTELVCTAYQTCVEQMENTQQAVQMLNSSKFMLKGVVAKIKVSLPRTCNQGIKRPRDAQIGVSQLLFLTELVPGSVLA